MIDDEHARRHEIHRLLRAARPEAALAEYLAHLPASCVSVLRQVDTPAVRAHLARLREDRSLECYAEATAVLAALGDEEARAETLRAMRAGRYRWVDEVCGDDAALATLGYDFQATIPFWLDELETNCCRRIVSMNVFEEAFGLGREVSDGFGEIPGDRMRRWWNRHRDGKFGMSRIAGHFVPYR